MLSAKRGGRTSRKRSRSTRSFLKGPVDMGWLRAAMSLRGAALTVAVQVRFICGLKRSNVVKVRLASIPVSRGAASRGLSALERAGLVKVKRTRGHWPTVTVVEVTQRSRETNNE